LKCVSSENKKNAFKTRDVNAAINIREITSLWIQNQKRIDVFKAKTDPDSNPLVRRRKVGVFHLNISNIQDKVEQP